MTMLGLLGSLLVLSAPGDGELKALRPPVPLKVDGRSLDVGRDGHSAPLRRRFRR